MRKPEILVVDDAKAVLAMMKDFLEEEGYKVTTTSSAGQALPLINKEKFDLVIMDIKMPGLNGLDALTEIKKIDSKLSVIIMTAYGTTQAAIEAMKRGAYDYITKPFRIEELKVLIKKAIEASRLMKESVYYQNVKDSVLTGDAIIGRSPQMLEVYKAIGKIAYSTSTVLIRGESGTGKKLVARAIYQNSSRKDNMFLVVDCAAMPAPLLENELFGYEKDPFTNAINKRIGKFQQCDGGTIFLDEIGGMSLSIQTKILRVLKEHTFEPVGSENTVSVDVRLIVSTSKDLWQAVEKGEFLEDLYYRLKAVTIFMPPLRQRQEDIPLLIDYFIKKFNKEFKKDIKGVSEEAIDYLMKYRWPGNVKELKSAIQTAVAKSKKDILLLDNFQLFIEKESNVAKCLSEFVSNVERMVKDITRFILDDPLIYGKVHKEIMGCVERILVDAVLNENGKNQVKTARVLGISRNTLRARIKEYNLINKINII